MKQICDSQIEFIQRGLKSGQRLDGRDPLEIRRFSLVSGESVIETANGASHLTLRNELEVLAGIKADLTTPGEDYNPV